jgi:pimeloyl-ACP methyl ester carboxylesterase
MDGAWVFLLVSVVVVGCWALAWAGNRRSVRRLDGSGEPSRGIIIFVEPVRWLFIVWGFAGFCRALRGAGSAHRLELFRWSRSAGSLFVLPDLMRRRRLDVKAARLARRLAEIRRTHPDIPLHVVAYSTGAYVAFEAVRRLPVGARVNRIVALHGTVSPRYDLREVENRCDGVLNVYGPVDFLINGVAPLIFGTNDRAHALASGMVGLRSPPACVNQRRWRFRDVALGYFGDHFTVMSPRWLRASIAPWLTETHSPPGSKAPVVRHATAPRTDPPRTPVACRDT